ncbi:hypothetical protein [Mucilaginibacter sp. HD30]
MKLSKDDVVYLNNFLNKELVYRETYNEMQDHILSALEEYPDNATFETAFHDIINTQFSGIAGLRAIDRQYRKHGVTEMRKKYLNHIANMFKAPSVFWLSITSISAYFLFNYLQKSSYWTVFLCVAVVPGLINGFRYIRMGYFYGTIKRSVSDDGFRLLKYLPGLLFTFFMFFHFVLLNEKPNVWINTVQPGAASIVFMIYFLHAVFFFKMYKEEFKVNIAR